MDNQKVDYTKLPPELLKKLTEAEKRSPQYQQLQAIQDIADMVQELLTQLSDDKKQDQDTQDKFGALLTDIRTSLAELNAKEAPESPDYSKPIVEALNKLEKALTAIEVNPQVQVSTPEVRVPKQDLSGVEKLLKNEVPKAFKQAIALIPQPEPNDDTPLLDSLASISEQLADIQVGVRLVPEPGNMDVQNPDGTYINYPSLFHDMNDIVRSNADSNGNYQTMLLKNGSSTLFTLTFTFDDASNVTRIQRS